MFQVLKHEPENPQNSLFYPETTTRWYDDSGNAERGGTEVYGQLDASACGVVRHSCSRSFYSAHQRLRYYQANVLNGGTCPTTVSYFHAGGIDRPLVIREATPPSFRTGTGAARCTSATATTAPPPASSGPGEREMGFAIDFVPDSRLADDSTSERTGRLVLGDFEEHFFASMEYWREPDYERQWREGLERILAGAAASCLITSVGRPDASGGVWWWILYRGGNRIHVQNEMCFFERLREPFDLRNPYAAVPPRTTMTEEGDPIPEWTITVAEIARFVASMRS